MKHLNRNYQNLLRNISTKVQTDLAAKIHDERIIKIEKLRVEKTNTFGWYVDIFRFKKITGRGTVEMWLDLFPNSGRPILSICFWSSDIERINKVANSCSDNFIDDHSTKVIRYEDGEVLVKPLAKKYFGKFLIEPYETKFITHYFLDEIKEGNVASSSLLKKLTKKTEWLMRATISALEIQSSANEDYAAIENRKIVAEHKRRERSKILADKVKIRDAFTCRVCDFNFNETYGHLGRGVAEAHHIISLSSLKRKVTTTTNDLITVCANCHRILHRMDGQADDYLKLRKILKK